MQSFPYHLGREGIALWSRVARGRILLIHVALIAVFGVYLPWTKGVEFLDPVITAAYACLGVVLAAPAAVQAFAAERPSSMTGAMARILTAVLYGEGMVLVILVTAFLTVFTTRSSGVLFVDLRTLASAGALGITASFAFAVVAAWVTLRFSANAARGTLRVSFLLLTVVFFFQSRRFPDVAGTGVVVSLVVGAAAALALRRLLGRSE